MGELTPSITVTDCLMVVLMFWEFQIWHVYDLELNIKLWHQITCHAIYYVHWCHYKINYVINQYSTDMDPFEDQYSIIGGRDDCQISRDHHCWHYWTHTSMVSYQKGPARHAYAWQIGPFWQDTLDITVMLHEHHDLKLLASQLVKQLVCWGSQQRNFQSQITGNSTCQTACLFRLPTEKFSNHHITGLMRGFCCWPANAQVTCWFPIQRANRAEIVSMW